MLNKIIGFAVGNKLIVALFVVALVGYGTYELTKLPIDAVPDITNNQVQVITIAPSFGATDIERLVTFPIEQANNNISGLKEIRSFSRFGLSLVTIVFEDDVDIYWARQQVSERLGKVQNEIPKGIGTPELGPISTGLGEIYQYVVRPKQGYEHRYNETDLRTIQDWIVRRQLLGVKGVAEVSSFGGKLKQYSIEIDPQKLLSYGITISDVFVALENNNENTGGAYIEKGPTVLFIRSEGLVENLDDIKNISVKNLSDGQPLLIRDVADVKTGFATRYGAMTYNDKGEVAGAVVMMLKGANSSEVIRNVKERVAQIQNTLPEGVVIEAFLDRTKMVNNAIGTVEKNLLEGALIVVFVLVLFLGNLRAGLLVASVIPLAMLFAVIMMNTFGVSGNLMSLGALDFGLIVDGAVIIVEAVMHQITHSKKFTGLPKITQVQMDQEVSESADRMMNSAVFGQVIILIVYLPIFTLQGIEGKMFKPMAQTVAFALLGAFILSLTYIPMMSAVFLSKKIKTAPGFSDRIMDKLSGKYRSALERVIIHPKMILLAVSILFGSAIYVLTSLGGEFIPALEEGDFAVDTRVLTGSNLTTTIANTQKAAHILKSQFPEVLKIVTKIGSGEVPTDPMPMEASDMMVILKDKNDWTSAKTFPELSEKMSEALKEVPGITAGFQFPVQMRFNELMTGARQDVVCKVFGENLDTLAMLATQLGAQAGQVKGTKNLYIEAVSGMPQVTIRYNRSALAQFGLGISAANRTVNTALAGQITGMVFEGEKRFELVVKLSGERKKNLADIQNLLIPLANGNQIPLYQLAEVKIQNGPNQIQREDAKRRIIVGFNIAGRDVQTIVNELQTKVNKNLKLPTGYYITYGGSFENLNAAKQRLMIAVPVSLVLIFVLLFFAFNSVKDGLLIYSAIPLSAIGGIFFLALRGMPFSISAGVGFIALFGVAVLNGIVLVAEFNRIRKDGQKDIRQAILEGTQHRLRPVLMTAFVASLGFFPMAVSSGAGAEVQRPLATVVIGGLLVATFLTLFVLPVLYLFFENGFKFKLKSKAALLSFLISFFFLSVSNCAFSQKKIDLKTARQIALANNQNLKTEKLRTQYQKALIQTAAVVPQTNFQFEAGQINSYYSDTRFNITQSVSLPVVYARQRILYQSELAASVLNVAVRENELNRNVGQVFYLILFQGKKLELLESLDSLYTGFSQRVQQRLEKGESDILEKLTIETQLAETKLQRQQLEFDLILSKLQFQLLLNAPEALEPAETDSKFTPVIANDSVPLDNHPQMRLLKQQQRTAAATIDTEKTKLLPQVSLGYNNMSMRGTGANDKTYTASQRFHSGQIGIGIPLFAGAQRARVISARINKHIADQNYVAENQIFRSEYISARTEYRKLLAAAQYYETEGLQSAEMIVRTANEQLTAGSINYLQWVQLVNHATSIRSQYLDALMNLNSKAIELNAYLEN
ncbi:CusA/CzcA family heavy metal efflux RND transporter [Dyadobacter psychrotolerans]|uniref:CusA/CzcA family heavy metal efflux RND transporter n=1 Tax=Dyadobacter psychrotolerans TaxID=2541721 RepID=A0A4R5DSL4_9BACT|nr:CusA/CzcA family heavy metal efflux RND transporter [Dyadobacter psychrotolerans]TDE15260.1 CusA/CzcA family heavy metal efflux RND transporter [Dyadobacter psychrotolerans]